MATLTINDFGAHSASLSLPRYGAWVLDAVVDAEDAITGAATVNIGDGALELHGTVRQGDTYGSITYLRVVGGAGGFAKTAPAKYYANPTLRIVLLDLLTAAGESLSSTADTNALTVRLQTWTTMAVGIQQVVTSLVQSASSDTAWRVLPDGKVWIGRDSWATTDADYEIVTEKPQERRVTLAMEAPTLLPGTSLADGRKVSNVWMTLTPNTVRADAWLEAA